MSVTPGGELDKLLQLVNDPLSVILIHLAKSPMPDPLDALVLADLVECDFDGYGPVAFVPDDTNQTDEDFYGETFSQLCTWMAESIVAPQIITGLYITMAYNGGAAVLMGTPTILNDPYTMDTPGQTYSETAILGSIADLP